MQIQIMKPTLPSLESMSERLNDVLSTGIVTNGKYVKEFETIIAEYLGSKYAIAVSSGTAGLILPLRCLDLTGEVIIPSFSWCATAHALLLNNLTPVFADINSNDFQINVKQVESLINDKTSAIMAVNIAGSTSNIKQLEDIANKYDISLIFDNAHSIGTQLNNRGIGSYGDACCYSFSATKTITTGEGGVITTNNPDLAKKISLARNQGVIDGNAQFVGMNARMSEFNALIGISMMEMVDELINKKNELVNYYIPELEKIPGIKLQHIPKNVRSSYKDLMVIIDKEMFGYDRDYLSKFLLDKKIFTKKYYSPPIHKQVAYTDYYEKYNSSLPVTNFISKNCINLPLFPSMKKDQIDRVISEIWSCHNSV